MSYKRKERDAAILAIGLGKPDFKNLPLYEDLRSFGWVVISRVNGLVDKIELSFRGKYVFKRLNKIVLPN